LLYAAHGIRAGRHSVKRLSTAHKRDAFRRPNESVVGANVCLVFLELGFLEIA
jgi:hypothetical protein